METIRERRGGKKLPVSKEEEEKEREEDKCEFEDYDAYYLCLKLQK
jgi:hypothetical protein